MVNPGSRTDWSVLVGDGSSEKKKQEVKSKIVGWDRFVKSCVFYTRKGANFLFLLDEGHRPCLVKSPIWKPEKI